MQRVKTSILPIWLMVALLTSACGPVPAIRTVAPTLTPTGPLPVQQPVMTPTLPRPTILDVFPLAVGTTWVYSVTLDTILKDQAIHWTGVVTETITEASQQGNGWIFRAETQGHPLQEEQPSERVQYYVALGNRLYRLLSGALSISVIEKNGQEYEWNQILTWPLEVGQQWGTPEFLARGDGWYVWRAEARETIETLAGVFADCYHLALWTNPDHIWAWFCPGVGLVRREYHHHGSPHDEVWVLQER